MQSKISLKWLSVIVVIEGVIFSAIIVFLLNPNLPTYIKLASLTQQVNVGLPVRLKIPKIKLDATIEQVSLTSQGAVGVPKGIVNAGWFNLGPRPGEVGNSIIDGHFGWWKNGTPGIFNNLYTLHTGDKIYIEDQTGTTITFVIRAIRTYNKNEDASSIFELGDGKAHLDLITCEGVWIPSQKTYSNRLIVFADKE